MENPTLRAVGANDLQSLVTSEAELWGWELAFGEHPEYTVHLCGLFTIFRLLTELH